MHPVTVSEINTEYQQTNMYIIFYLNHYDWSAITIEIWLDICKEDTQPAINGSDIFYVNNLHRRLLNYTIHIQSLATVRSHWWHYRVAEYS